MYELNSSRMDVCEAVLYLQKEVNEEPNGKEGYCKAFLYLQMEEIVEPNEKSCKTCEAVPYLQENRSEELNEEDYCKAVPYLQKEMNDDYSKNYVRMIKYDLLTLCRSLVECVIEMIGWWTLAFLNKVYKMVAALCEANPAMEMLHYVKKVNYQVMTWTWQSLCPAMAWLLSSRTSLAWHLWCFAGWMGRGVEGQIFQHAMFGMLTMFSVVLMATYMRQRISRHVAVREHMSRICKHRQRRESSKSRRQLIAIIFLCSMTSAAAMEQDAVLQRIITLTEAATRAAMSAESTLNQVQSRTSTSTASGSAEGLQAASRILKAPDTFSGDDPHELCIMEISIHELVDIWW